MKIINIMVAGMIITISALGYVYQRVEIVKEGYILQQKMESLGKLQNENAKLIYDISKIESPRYLLAALSHENFEFTGQREERTDIYKLALAEPVNYALVKENLFGRFMDLFTPSAEAKPRH